jgi:GcrA cell cycle regulator
MGNKKWNPPARPRATPTRRVVQPDADPFVPTRDEVVIPQHERKTIQTLEADDCRWPIGDPIKADFHFCGKTKVAGLPYCEHHAQRAYQSIPLSVRAPTRTVISPIIHAHQAKEDA